MGARVALAEPRTAARAAETIGGRLLRLPRELTAPRGSALGASACARQWGVAPRAPAPLLFGATLSTLNNARGPTQGVTSDATSAPKKRGKSGHHDDAELPGGRGGGLWTEGCGGDGLFRDPESGARSTQWGGGLAAVHFLQTLLSRIENAAFTGVRAAERQAHPRAFRESKVII